MLRPISNMWKVDSMFAITVVPAMLVLSQMQK